MDNNMVNHWGKWVDKTEPVTGVISINDVCQFVCDECCNGLDLNYEQAEQEFLQGFQENHGGADPTDEDWNDFNSEMEMCESGDTLIGDWIKDSDGLYDADRENGEYAAIVRESVVQVVWSKYVIKCKNLCSPCYPGQADVNSGNDEPDGEFLAYNLPPEAYEY